MIILKFTQKVSFNPHTLKTIYIRYLNIFFNSILVQKFIYFYFSILGLRDKRERSLDFGVEREKYNWHRFYPLKQSIFVSNGSIWWKKFILGDYLPWKCLKKIYELGRFLVLSLFRVPRCFFGFFMVMDEFITIPKMFSRCFG